MHPKRRRPMPMTDDSLPVDKFSRAAELRTLLEKYQRAYYVDGRPLVSDLEKTPL